MGALLSFRGASVQSELDAFFASLGTHGAGVLVSDRALAKARAKLHVPALWALNDRLIAAVETAGQMRRLKGRRLVCADGTLLAPAQRACLRTRSLAAPVQRALGLYLPGNDLMLHVAVGTEAEGERQMLFDQLDRLRRGDVLILDRGFPASWLVQALSQRGIDFVIRCDSTQGWGAARSFLRSGQAECWDYLSPCDAGQARTWELDGPAQMHARLVRHVSASGRTRVLATSLTCSNRIGLTYASVECSRVRLYHSTQAMTSSLAWRRVTKRCPCSRSTFNEPNSVSLQALSQQLPRRLMDALMPYSVSTPLKSSLAYWLLLSL